MMFKGALKKCLLVFFVLWISPSLAESVSPDNSFASRKEVQQFIQQMSNKHGFDKNYLTILFKKFPPQMKIVQLMDKPSEAMPWYRYRDRLLSTERINKGVIFWKQHAKILKQVENEYGVPPEIIVAILGVETFYGEKTGTYPVLQSLATLSFDYPRRAQFFRSELEQFLLLVKDEKLDPIKTLGSYSGAIGAPQFMPSSYRRFAVDYQHKGKRDLANSMQDTIASVANYFKIHGWRTGEPVAIKAAVTGTRYQTLANQKGLQPNLTLQELANYNIHPNITSASRDKTKKAKFIALVNDKNGIEPWLGFHNFYVITRYNHSTNYAMAVYLLSQRIRAQH